MQHVPSRKRERLSLRFWFAAIVVMATFSLSGQALIALGQNYMLGSQPEKIHPATYFATLFLIIQFFLYGKERFMRVLSECYGSVFLIISVLVLTLYVALFLEVPAAGLPDTWLLPAMTFMLCIQLKDHEAALLGTVLTIFLTCNSIIGMGEVMLDKRIVPLSIASSALGQYIYPIEWRASGFLGHPLTAAYTTGCFILLLVLDQRVKNLYLRLAAIAINSVALLSFGSRGAMAFLVVTLVVCLVAGLLKTVVTRKIPKDLLIYIALVMPVAVIGVPTVLASGLADRFIKRFESDNGSALSRLDMLDMFHSFSWSDIIIGPPRTFMEAMGVRYKIGSGIESFWFGFLFTFGIVGCVIFMPSLFMFCRNLYRKSGFYSLPVLLFFFACCSTSVSLSSRSLDLAYVVGLTMTSRHRAASALRNSRRSSLPAFEDGVREERDSVQGLDRFPGLGPRPRAAPQFLR